ncbi:luciferase [Halobacteriales archaeon QS_3_64_16]|nr:MAG: luciferase [Halobacteriales archaeon QS_3_64_16]
MDGNTLHTEREVPIARTGLDGIALKPAECAVSRGSDLDTGILVIDYEGEAHLPDGETLRALAADDTERRVTTPVRTSGFDPLGDNSLAETLPSEAKRVLVAGHAAYLTEDERARPVAPRLQAAREKSPEAWVGTEGIERLALAAGGTQFELLSRTTLEDVRSLRAAGFTGEIAVYAPVVLTDDDDAVLDALGAYVARRGPVARALPENVATDRRATGRGREVLSAASRDYALVGTPEGIREQVRELEDAGVDLVIGYPARGIEEFLD